MRCLVTGVKRSYWSLYHREVGSILIQGGFEGCPVIVEGATHRDQWVFCLQRTGDFGSVNGQRLDAESVFVIPPGGQFCFTSPGELDWQSVHIPTEILFSTNSAPDGTHESSRVVKPGYGLDNRLRTVVDQFAQAAEVEPLVMTEPASVFN